ncbi:MAG: DUF1700 domain-containing protein [Clostridium sp.]|nr:DUF1700 domain-containing protein [Clostridium sp.]
MNRQEFIEELRKAMSGSFSVAEIEDAAAYYEDYMTMQMKKGRQEDEILKELGSPRLIVKSMKAAGGTGAWKAAGGGADRGAGAQRGSAWNAKSAGAQNGAYGDMGRNTDRQRNGYAQEDGSDYDEDAAFNGGMHTFRLPMWLVLLVVVLLLLAVLTIVFRVLIALLPIILIAAGAITIYRYFAKK